MLRPGRSKLTEPVHRRIGKEVAHKIVVICLFPVLRQQIDLVQRSDCADSWFFCVLVQRSCCIPIARCSGPPPFV